MENPHNICNDCIKKCWLYKQMKKKDEDFEGFESLYGCVVKRVRDFWEEGRMDKERRTI